MNEPRAVSIILAAGSSTRLRPHKALLEIDGKPAVLRIVDTVLRSKNKRCLIVTGAQAEAIQSSLDGLAVEIVHNRQFQNGRTGSIKVALRYLGGELTNTAVFIFPVDCPFIEPDILDNLYEALLALRESEKQSLWILPKFGQRGGHPALIYGPILNQILSLDDDYSLRDFLNCAKTDKRILRRIDLPVDCESVLDNMNSRLELIRLCRREGILCNA